MYHIRYLPPENEEITQIYLPLSKSFSNRLLILKYLANEDFSSEIFSKADDTILLSEKLDLIKKNIDSKSLVEINVNNAGTVMRFLTSLLSITKGNWLLTGSNRMKNRPISELVNVLIKLGAKIEYIEKEAYPPLRIRGSVLKGGKIEIYSSVSSQYISSLLLISPFLEDGLQIKLKGRVASHPYILMTLNILKLSGVDYQYVNNEITVKKSSVNIKNIDIENDWSSAAFWYEIISFSSIKNLKINGLKRTDIQGDAILQEIFINFGVKTDFTDDGIILSKIPYIKKDFSFDFTDFPDIVQSVAVSCALLGINAELRGLENLKIKETDRLEALSNELKKMNVIVEIVNHNKLIIRESKLKIAEVINCYDDHRMIMSFAPLAIINENIQLDNISEVSKSYPTFWEEVKKIGIFTE